jgi:hypothetical protein
MRILTGTLLPILFLTSSCSFMLNHGAPRYTADRTLIVDSCRQSNWPAGTDLLFVTTGLIVGGATDEEGNPVGLVPGLVIMAVTGASMIYGFIESSQCRRAHASAGFSVHGANDWLIPPGLLLAGLGAVFIAQQPSRGATHAEQDSCKPGEPITASCNDGTLSCSLHRRGTCAHHGGVRTWYRQVLP